MPKKIIHIKNPSSGSEFRTLDGGTGGGKVRSKPDCVQYTQMITEMLMWVGGMLHEGHRGGGGGGGPSFHYKLLKPRKPTGITGADIHNCPTLTQVLLGLLDIRLERLIRHTTDPKQKDALRKVRAYTVAYSYGFSAGGFSQEGSHKSKRLTALQEASIVPAITLLITTWPVVAPFIF